MKSLILIECGVERLTLRKGDGLRVDVEAGTVQVFRDDDAPALLRGQIPARVTLCADGVKGGQTNQGENHG